MKKQDMNLLARYNEANKSKASQYSDRKLYTVIILVVVLLFGGYSIKLYIDNMLLNRSIDNLKSFVENPNTIARLNYINELQEDIQQIDVMLNEVNSINEVFDAAIRYDSQVLNVIYYMQPDRVNLENISYQEGILSVSFSGPNAYDASNYVLRLIETGYFKSVRYAGYAFNESDGLYYATLQCYVKGGN